MISFEQFTLEEGIPIYLQIIRYIQRGIAAGTIIDHDEMPSRRMLSALLGVNPNTIQKAYKILEDDNIIESRSGTKSFVIINEQQIQKIRDLLLNSDVQTLVNGMKQMNISKSEALLLIEKAWEEN